MDKADQVGWGRDLLLPGVSTQSILHSLVGSSFGLRDLPYGLEPYGLGDPIGKKRALEAA